MTAHATDEKTRALRRMKGVALAALLLALACAAKAIFGANYLFLRSIPDGTPFSFLSALSPAPRAALWGAFMAAALLLNTRYIRRKTK